MTTRTVTAMFNTRSEAEHAAQALASELGLDRSMIRISPSADLTDAGYDATRPYEEKGFFASLKDLSVPDEDRYTFAEGMRRGAVLLSTPLEESRIHNASDIIERAGALDLDEQEAGWKRQGWKGYDASAHMAARPMMATGTATGTAKTATTTTGATMGATGAAAMPRTGQDETIKVMEERLSVGKRVVEGGRVKVRAYVVERPVEERVTLHEESVHVERHAVDRAATAADMDAFRERTLEAHATSEEAVVAKDARVVEEISLHKQAADRTETVRDTVRKTEVEVEDAGAHGRVGGAAAQSGAGMTTGRPAVGPGTGTGAVGTMDRALGTDVSGTNPAAHAPDGTPGNPKGTMASRAVDKTLGTNISGANPGHKS